MQSRCFKGAHALSDENIELDKPNAVGVLDRLTTNVALALIVVFPTFVVSIATPWRLAPLIAQDNALGRTGMLIAPGAYLPLAMLIAFLGAALVANPEIANNSGAFLGPGLALSIQSAVGEGDVWQVVAAALPIYLFAVVVGALGVVNTYILQGGWSLRASLRSTFYVVGTMTAFIMLATAAIDVLRFTPGLEGVARVILVIIPVPILGIMLWMYTWFFRVQGQTAWWRCILAALVMFGLKLAVLTGVGVASSVSG